jgi:hydrogenase expression/formation protein HypE
MSHGGGGTRSRELIENMIAGLFKNPILGQMDDSALLSLPDTEIAFTTDSYVVRPLFFPGGDIGKLAACGTLNDLAVQAARPLYLSLGLILEEGFALPELETVLRSMAEVLENSNVRLVTGDTKVVERGAGFGVLINTSGIGVRTPGIDARVSNARPGDVVILSGTLGDHGIAVLSRREGLEFETELESDTAVLWPMIAPLLDAGLDIHCLRDPTRGGAAQALCDIAESSGAGIRIREKNLPIRPPVRAACRLLGFDPLEVANEGKAIVICPAVEAQRALEILRAHPAGRQACIIGDVEEEPRSRVLLETAPGGRRLVDAPSGENLPRIC